MRVIFLDIDGVIVTKRSEVSATSARRDHYQRHGEDVPYLERCRLKADPDCVAVLNGLIESTGAHIVVSSAWRHGCHTVDLAETLAAMGVIGTVISRTVDGDLSKRGEQISHWLRHTKYPVKSYVVLDDMDIQGHDGRFVRTVAEHGLDAADAWTAACSFENQEVGL